MKIFIRNQQRRRALNKTKIIRTVRTILSLLGQPTAELSILFVGDRRMLKLNTLFRGIHKSTDVLSFEAGIPIKREGVYNVLGDVVISVPRAEHQAGISGTGFYDELYRLLVHGTLHLLGYNHEKSNYRAHIMRKKEEEIFNALKKVH